MTKTKLESDGIMIEIPKSAENVELPNPELLTYYQNLEDRVLWLDSIVDETWLEFERKILEWNKEDKGVSSEKRKPIKLFIHSYGGDLDINNSLIDVIRLSKTPIWGINMGQACSAACFIFIACHKRFAMPNSTFLIHQGEGNGFSGTYSQVVSAVMEYQRKIEELEQYLKSTTKIPDDILEERITTEWFISSEEAVKYGIADEIITDIDEIL